MRLFNLIMVIITPNIKKILDKIGISSQEIQITQEI